MTIIVGRCLLREILEDRKMSIQELANKLDVSRQQVSKYVNNSRKMSLETAIKIAYVLNVDVLDLYEVGTAE